MRLHATRPCCRCDFAHVGARISCFAAVAQSFCCRSSQASGAVFVQAQLLLNSFARPQPFEPPMQSATLTGVVQDVATCMSILSLWARHRRCTTSDLLFIAHERSTAAAKSVAQNTADGDLHIHQRSAAWPVIFDAVYSRRNISMCDPAELAFFQLLRPALVGFFINKISVQSRFSCPLVTGRACGPTRSVGITTAYACLDRCLWREAGMQPWTQRPTITGGNLCDATAPGSRLVPELYLLVQ
ncbi:hypothetical protein T440DRAFT_111306 [Plenodomus tracheiphilus IPT5]|uniref:Uncharacterized protein n=1 Tax=Plenodomus tracheiphilus IPT5 TaxID=1408161 RepID=A0A6A7B489_9PLEO|nr:hypothetical protein T440DRAFT_111306 [Plenodomus tracheiphilus IPT5]